MPDTTITGSNNVAILASKIVADLCAGAFYIDLTPTTWIADGYDNVEGASVRITNPYGVVVKEYPTSGYDIYPPMDGVAGFDVPTQAGNYQYGNYTIEVRLTDSDGTEYTVTKTLNLCQPDANNKTRNYGSLSAQLNGICLDGKLYVIVDTPPNYKGKIVQSQVNDFTLEYPTSSGMDELETDMASFSTYLFEGVYKINGTICALYDLGDYMFVKINYKVKRKKEIYCTIDECCVFAKLSELNLKIKSDCTQAEKDNTASITLDALRLLKTAQLAATCGEDPSDYIADLEALLGCKCTCNCNEGAPIINNNPSKDFNITGCNITKETVGLTDNYTIENYAYTVQVVANGGVLVVSSQTLSSCTKTQVLTFNIAAAYTQIRNLANDNASQAIFWASIINKPLNSIDVTCMGISAPIWSAMTFAEKWTAITQFMCNCCNCSATISDVEVERVGVDATLTWEATDAYSVDIYVDGIFVGNVLSSIEEFTLIGYADGLGHTYLLTPKCSDGKVGTSATGEFTFLACPQIEPPSVSSNNENGVDCPYDLTALVASLPSGIEAEWHTANNTLDSTLLGDPTAVNSGVYYVFAKDSNGCYSIGVSVTVICDADSNCTAPQSLLVTTITGGNLVEFQSAAFPPPLNSYTVKRKPGASADIPGNYTTIGTPSFNVTSGRWEILDASAVDNTLYTYKAQSNCSPDTPYILYNYANIICPDLTLTPGVELIDYSFVGVGGDVTKYDVQIYDISGVTLLHTDTHLPAFPNPIEGTFMYLDANTSYKVRTKVYIGIFSKTCDFVIGETEPEGGVIEGNIGSPNTIQIRIVLDEVAPCSDTVYISGTYLRALDGLTYNWHIDAYSIVIGTTTQVIQNAISEETGVALTGSDEVLTIDGTNPWMATICGGTVLLSLENLLPAPVS